MSNGEPSYLRDINLRSRLHAWWWLSFNCFGFYWSKYVFCHLPFRDHVIDSPFNIKQANWPSAMGLKVFFCRYFFYQIPDFRWRLCLVLKSLCPHKAAAMDEGGEFSSFCIKPYDSHTYWKSHHSKLLEACILHRALKINIPVKYDILWPRIDWYQVHVKRTCTCSCHSLWSSRGLWLDNVNRKTFQCFNEYLPKRTLVPRLFVLVQISQKAKLCLTFKYFENSFVRTRLIPVLCDLKEKIWILEKTLKLEVTVLVM